MSEESERNYTREEVLAMMDTRKAKETDLAAWISVLESQDVGMDGPLVDNEDYPRNDIDVHKVREARHQIIVLRNDLKALTNQIEKALHNLHQQSREGIGAKDPGEVIVKLEGASLSLPTPFLNVDQVTAGSPAEYAGLKVGDKVVEFGTLKSDNFSSLKSVSTIVEASVNQNIRVRVIRDGSVKTLLLKPKAWSGGTMIEASALTTGLNG